MVKEHAITLNGGVTAENWDYLIKKANRLGKVGRDISRVVLEEDAEGVHVYFEVEPLEKSWTMEHG